MKALLYKTSIVLISLLLLTACNKKLILHVDAIKGQPLGGSEKSYVLKSGLKNIAEGDLYFQEFSAYAHHILKQQGYTLSQKGDKAALTIYLSYGVSGTKVTRHRYSTPTYDFVGGDTVTIHTASVNADGDQTISSQQVYIPTRLKQTGREFHNKKTVLHILYLKLEAKSRAGSNKPIARWSASVETSSTNKDLRNLMPYLATALQPYLGKDTGEVVVTTLKERSPEVVKFKNRVLNEK